MFLMNLFNRLVFHLKIVLRNIMLGSFNAVLYKPYMAELAIKIFELLLFNLPFVLRFSIIWRFIVRQRWQFALELAYHRSGKPRVKDPLFLCDIQAGKALEKSDNNCIGTFDIYFLYNGLVISGYVQNHNYKSFNLCLDDKIIKKTNFINGKYYPTFKIKIKRNVLNLFPDKSNLVLKVEDGKYLKYKNSGSVNLLIPHGNGSIIKFIGNGGKISKKGTLSATPEQTRERQNVYLNVYDKAKLFFDKEIGKTLFLMYGTLLGFYRGGDFIPGDDDFDGGYISEKTNAKDVKEEIKEIVIKLVQSGFTVTFNRSGRLFRLQLERGATDGYHLDLRPLWFEGKYMWAHKQARIICTKDDFLPAGKGLLRGVEVYVPRLPEVMLSGYYGPGWRVPDPGYVNDNSCEIKEIIKYLNKALITPREYLQMKKFFRSKEGAVPGMGRFVSTSLQDLYPLDEYID